MRAKLGAVTSKLPADVRNFLDRVRETLTNGDIVTSDTLGSMVSDSVNLAISGIRIPTGTGGTVTPIHPPAPTNVTASGAMTSIFVMFDMPLYGGHSYAEIWRADTNDIGVAQLVGQTPGSLYADAVGAAASKWYWVRFVSITDNKGPFNGTAGTHGQTSPDTAYLLEQLNGALTESHLYADLSSRIDLIDGTGAGSVNARLLETQSVLQSQINDLSSTAPYDAATTYAVGDMVTYGGFLYQALSTTTGNIPTNTVYWQKIGDYTSLGDSVAANSAAITAINTVTVGSTSAAASQLAILKAAVNDPSTGLAKAQADIAAINNVSASSTSASAQALQTVTARFTGFSTGQTVDSRISNYAYAKSDVDGAISSLSSTLTAAYTSADLAIQGTNQAYVQSYAYAKAATYTQAQVNAAISNANLTITTTLDSHTTAIQTNATSINGILGKYTVKIDNNGYVTGYGLISENNNGTPVSEFAIVADKFSIAPVATSYSSADGSPFFYLTVPTTINGAVVPAGAYMKSAYIHDASITNAKIQSLSADKLVSGSIATNLLTANVITAINASLQYISAQRIDTHGLNVYDLAGNLTMSSGTLTNAALTIGYNGNWLTNTELVGGVVAPWEIGWNPDGAVISPLMSEIIRYPVGLYVPPGKAALVVEQLGRTSGATENVACDVYAFSGFSGPSVKAGDRHEFHAMIAAHRCDVRVIVGYLDASGNWISGADSGAPARASGGQLLTGWNRIGVIATAPAGAARVAVIVRKFNTDAGQTNSYAWVMDPFFSQAGANQTEFSAYSPGSPAGALSAIDQINQSNVSTYIAAASIGSAEVGNLQSDNYAAGSTGWRIAKDGTAEFRNVVVRGDVQATSLSAATGTFAGQLSAATGTFAGQLSAATGTFAGQLSAATGSFGNVSVVGTVSVSATGAVMGGQTAYDTGNGFFLGYTAGLYKFGLRNGSDYLRWGTAGLEFTGKLIDNRPFADGNAVVVMSSGSVRSTNYSTYRLMRSIVANRTGTVRMKALVASVQGYTCYFRITKNLTSAPASDFGSDTSTDQDGEEIQAVFSSTSVGDEFQIWARSGGGSSYAEVIWFALCSDVSNTPAIAIL